MTSHPRAASWAERAATAAIFLASGTGTGAWAAAVAAFKVRLSLSNGALSLVLLAFVAGAVLSMAVLGPLMPRVGSGRAIRVTAPAFGVALTLSPFSRDFAALAAAAFVAGVAGGALDLAMNAHATGVERRWGGAIMSSFHAAFSAGGLVGAGLGMALAAAGAEAFWGLAVAGALTAVTAAAAWRSLGRGDLAEGRPELALPGRSALPLCAAALLCMLCEGAMADWSGVYLETVVLAPAALAAAGYAAFSAAMIAGRITGDTIVRALGRPWVVRGGGGLAAAGLALAAAVPAPLPAIAGFALVGLGLANVVPAVFSAAGRLGASPAGGIAMAATAGYAGFLIGPPVIGGLAAAAGLQAGFVLLAACAGAVALLAGAVRVRVAAY